MKSSSSLLSFSFASLRIVKQMACVIGLCAVMAPPAWAEKADRYQPLTLVADQQGTLDMAHKVAVFTGNVVVTKGTLVIEADRVEVRDLPNGSRQATALGSASRQASFRQKRDAPNEFIFGKADRLEYDEKADTVRFISRAIARRLTGETVTDEISGDVLVYDGQADFFTASAPSAPSAASGAAGGRVRITMSPREAAPPINAAPKPSTPPKPSAEPAREAQ